MYRLVQSYSLVCSTKGNKKEASRMKRVMNPACWCDDEGLRQTRSKSDDVQVLDVLDAKFYRSKTVQISSLRREIQ